MNGGAMAIWSMRRLLMERRKVRLFMMARVRLAKLRSGILGAPVREWE